MINEPISGEQLKTKVIVCDYFLTSNYGWLSLEEKINEFVNSEPMDVIGVQFSSVVMLEDKVLGYYRKAYVQKHAMIIYKTKATEHEPA